MFELIEYENLPLAEEVAPFDYDDTYKAIDAETH